GHAVLADSIVLGQLEGEPELGAHAVRARDQHPLGPACRVHPEQAAEAAQAPQTPGPVRARHVAGDAGHRFVALVDVNTRVPVRQTFAFHRSSSAPRAGRRVETEPASRPPSPAAGPPSVERGTAYQPVKQARQNSPKAPSARSGPPPAAPPSQGLPSRPYVPCSCCANGPVSPMARSIPSTDKNFRLSAPT